MKLAEISIKRPTLVIVLFTVLILGGLLSYTSLNYELLPKFARRLFPSHRISRCIAKRSREHGIQKN